MFVPAVTTAQYGMCHLLNIFAIMMNLVESLIDSCKLMKD